MPPHSSLNIFLDVLAVQIDTGHQNSRMYEIATMRVLQRLSYDILVLGSSVHLTVPMTNINSDN